jgi:uncharacterized protein (TIGR02452 family)
MSRNKRASIAKETLEIVDRGWYEVLGSGRVWIRPQIEACLNATVLLRSEDFERFVAANAPAKCATRFDVRNETTLSAARRLVADHGCPKVLALNFASAKNPGGGFLGGSQAQEESLARSSALYASLLTQPEYYETNRACRTALYTNQMILSPGVPVFRNDEGELLSEPYMVGMLTAPAVNAGAVLHNEPANVALIHATMAGRIEKVLAAAVQHQYEHLVLGAWGCGVFRNDPEAIAQLFFNALQNNGAYAGAFESVTFAILDGTADQSIIQPFTRRFTGSDR